MKCPLLWLGCLISPREVTARDGDCLKKECPWWDKDKGMCFRASEVLELGLIRSLLREIRDKVPHSGQFGK